MTKKLFAAICAGVLLVSGCGADNQSDVAPAAPAEVKQEVFATIEDDAGRTVVLDKQPARLVVTSAGFLEPLHATGGEIVGRPDSKNQMENKIL